MIRFKLFFGVLWLVAGLAATVYTSNAILFQGILGLGVLFNGYNLMKINTK